MFVLNTACTTHPGKLRAKNEDALIFGGKTAKQFCTPGEILCSDVSLEQPCLFGVFDGMGGHVCGDRASQIAAECAAEAANRISPQTAVQSLTDICMTANQRICSEMAEEVKGQMGSTASMLCFFDGHFVLCNIGDSPVFRIRNAEIQQISYAHTEYHNYVKILGHEPPLHQKFKLTQYLGVDPEEFEIEPYVQSDRIQKNDAFLICSDGITDMLEEPDILHCFLAHDSVQETAAALLNGALARGGKDNISLICIRVRD